MFRILNQVSTGVALVLVLRCVTYFHTYLHTFDKIRFLILCFMIIVSWDKLWQVMLRDTEIYEICVSMFRYSLFIVCSLTHWFMSLGWADWLVWRSGLDWFSVSGSGGPPRPSGWHLCLHRSATRSCQFLLGGRQRLFCLQGQRGRSGLEASACREGRRFFGGSSSSLPPPPSSSSSSPPNWSNESIIIHVLILSQREYFLILFEFWRFGSWSRCVPACHPSTCRHSQVMSILRFRQGQEPRKPLEE